MITLKELGDIMENICPLAVSEACKALGMHDNSGLIVSRKGGVHKIAFSLDLSEKVVEEAAKSGCDCVITHHPAIYYGLMRIGEDSAAGAAVAAAVAKGMAVFSQHLNLDLAPGGIDDMMAYGLGAVEFTALSSPCAGAGYGKAFEIPPVSLGEFAERVKVKFGTEKLVVYGDPDRRIEKVASFCGAGGDEAAEHKDAADVFVTSDAPHHVIREIVENGKALLLLPHYAAENYGFKAFFAKMKGLLAGRAETEYFEDGRYL